MGHNGLGLFAILISMVFIGCNITGTVTDRGAPVEGVTLTLSDGMGIKKTIVTDKDGKYIFEAIPSGNYVITPSMEGYIFYPKMQPVIHTVGHLINVDFENFDTAVESISVMTVPGTDYVKTGADLKIMAVGIFKNGKNVIVSEYLNWRSENEAVCKITDYSLFAKLAVGISPGTATLIAETNTHRAEITLEVRDIFYQDADFLLPDLAPPDIFPQVINGCCIETCIWTILNAKGITLPISMITGLGNLHPEGWGLGTLDIINVLDLLGINHTITYSKKVDESEAADAKTYEDILRENIIARVKAGVPVMFGLKYLPYDESELYLSVDHFVLAVGYNEKTDEIIYNDMNQVNRSTVTKLTDGSFGYTAMNIYDITYVVEFPDYKIY